eukprot:6477669-Amphidinium_carterae.2
MHLRYVGVKPSTIDRYKKAVGNFFSYLRGAAFAYPRSYEALDYWLSEYINHLWQDDGSSNAAAYTIAGLQRLLPQAKRKLPTSW